MLRAEPSVGGAARDQEQLDDRFILVGSGAVVKSRCLSIQVMIYSVILPAIFLNRAGIT